MSALLLRIASLLIRTVKGQEIGGLTPTSTPTGSGDSYFLLIRILAHRKPSGTFLTPSNSINIHARSSASSARIEQIYFVPWICNPNPGSAFGFGSFLWELKPIGYAYLVNRTTRVIFS
ncbi:hypothetical protein ANO14919_009130 [Xylariales sp. No.14919]|nr:hypothetical protein ANO14919_009130 [Xylariales sp. No.14919]